MRTCNIQHRIIKSVCHVHKNSRHQCDVHYTKIVIAIFVTYIGDKIIKLMLLDREKPTLSARKLTNAMKTQFSGKNGQTKSRHFAYNSGAAHHSIKLRVPSESADQDLSVQQISS